MMVSCNPVLLNWRRERTLLFYPAFQRAVRPVCFVRPCFHQVSVAPLERGDWTLAFRVPMLYNGTNRQEKQSKSKFCCMSIMFQFMDQTLPSQETLQWLMVTFDQDRDYRHSLAKTYNTYMNRHILTPLLPPQSSWSGAMWAAVSWATVLSNTLKKLNSQLIFCVCFLFFSLSQHEEHLR